MQSFSLVRWRQLWGQMVAMVTPQYEWTYYHQIVHFKTAKMASYMLCHHYLKYLNIFKRMKC